MPHDAKPTLHDVGALAGVAARTVSRVINREAGVSERTAEKVRRAVQELNFRPNLAARALRGDRSLLVAIVNNNPWPRYVADVVRGVSMACRQAGTYLTFEEFSPEDRHIAASMADLIDNVGIAGTILIPILADDEELLDMLERRSVRIVRMSPARDIGRTDAVITSSLSTIANSDISRARRATRPPMSVPARSGNACTIMASTGLPFCSHMATTAIYPERKPPDTCWRGTERHGQASSAPRMTKWRPG